MRSIEYHSQSGLRVGGFQERENVLSLVRDGHDACARLDLVLASLCGSTEDPYKVFFPGVHARKFRSAPGGSRIFEIAH